MLRLRYYWSALFSLFFDNFSYPCADYEKMEVHQVNPMRTWNHLFKIWVPDQFQFLFIKAIVLSWVEAFSRAVESKCKLYLVYIW